MAGKVRTRTNKAITSLDEFVKINLQDYAVFALPKDEIDALEEELQDRLDCETINFNDDGELEEESLGFDSLAILLQTLFDFSIEKKRFTAEVSISVNAYTEEHAERLIDDLLSELDCEEAGIERVTED